MATCIDETRVGANNRPQHRRIITTLYDLVAAVEDAVTADEEAWVAPLVMHLLQTGRACWLRTLEDNELPWDKTAPSWQSIAPVRVPVHRRADLAPTNLAYARQDELSEQVAAVG